MTMRLGLSSSISASILRMVSSSSTSACPLKFRQRAGRVSTRLLFKYAWQDAMHSGLRARLTRLRGIVFRDEAPRLADETRWYTEHTALLISTLKWAMLGAVAGVCVGLGTRVFLWALARRGAGARGPPPASSPFFFFLPVALPLCVWIIRTFAADARGHGTEAVIAAVHQRAGRVDWLVAPVKLSATVVTLAFGG